MNGNLCGTYYVLRARARAAPQTLRPPEPRSRLSGITLARHSSNRVADLLGVARCSLMGMRLLLVWCCTTLVEVMMIARCKRRLPFINIGPGSALSGDDDDWHSPRASSEDSVKMRIVFLRNSYMIHREQIPRCPDAKAAEREKLGESGSVPRG